MRGPPQQFPTWREHKHLGIGGQQFSRFGAGGRKGVTGALSITVYFYDTPTGISLLD